MELDCSFKRYTRTEHFVDVRVDELHRLEARPGAAQDAAHSTAFPQAYFISLGLLEKDQSSLLERCPPPS